jgi:rhamnogalacturonan endolyase
MRFVASFVASTVVLSAIAYAADRDALFPAPHPQHKDKPLVKGWAKARVEEKLDRGIIATATKDGKVYVGWRLLKTDPEGTAFDLYRSGKDGKAARLNAKAIATTTDYVDDKPLSEDATYFVVPLVKGKEQKPSEKVMLKAGADKDKLYYTSIKFRGDYRPQKVAIADLNGDGKYDFVIKQPEQGVDPGVGGPDMTGLTYKVEAYLSDGTFLWQRDLGQGIEPGIWWSPIVVYDFDGDGKAEVALKTAPMDQKREGGRIRTGPEYCSILDGTTGKEITKVDWLPRDPRLGDYNRINRNQIGVAYLDGKTPCLIVARGTYRLMMVDAYQYKNKKLTKLWHWEGDDETPIIRGQGAHTMTAADVDGDGRDEILLGSACLDDNGTCLWSTGLGHPDSMYCTDIDPQRPGVEVLYGLEVPHDEDGICVVEARTGQIIWGLKQETNHIGGAMTADIDPTIPGLECWGGEDSKGGSSAKYIFSAAGKRLDPDMVVPSTRPWFYWDADPIRETTGRSGFSRNDPNFARLMGPRPAAGQPDPNRPRRRVRTQPPRFDPNDPNTARFMRMMNRPVDVVKYGGKLVAAGAIEGRMVAQADILGDWREEVITTLPGELRIYTTTIPATDRRVCLMQDPVYRSMVADLASGYAQTPVTSYYIGVPAAEKH